MSTPDDRGAAAKVLDVLDALSGHAVTGVSNTALSSRLKPPASAVTRAMDVLIERGWARKDEASGHFHATPGMAQVFGRVLADLDRAEQRLADLRSRFSQIV